MTRHGAEPYVFVGTEAELVDADRYERALRAWTSYLLEALVQDQLKRRHQVVKAV